MCQQCLEDGDQELKNFHDKLSRMKLGIFANMMKMSKVIQVEQKKMITTDRNLFSRMVITAESRDNLTFHLLKMYQHQKLV